MPPPIHRRSLALLIATALAFGLLWLAHSLLSNAGDVVAAVLLSWPRDRLLASAFRAVLALMGAPLVLYAWHRLTPSVHPAIPLAVVSLWVGAKYLDTLRDNDHFVFAPGIVTLPPGKSIEDHNPNRPQHPYRINALGFRMPDWQRARSAGTVRGVVIGDSYVFGIGVPEDETLPRHLAQVLGARHPERHLEVLNLGMPGNNFASYVDLYQAARAELDFDFAVLCLTLPNDLSRWDWAREWHEAHRLSLYSAARFVLGSSVASALWGNSLLEEGVRPAAVAAFQSEGRRLLEGRQRTGEVPLVVLSYRFQGALIDDALGLLPHVKLLGGVGQDADFIAGDGHPNEQGNRRFAPIVADALESLPEVQALLGK